MRILSIWNFVLEECGAMRRAELGLLVFSTSVLSVFGALYSPKVCTEEVCFKGQLESGLQKPYDAFYGIPFAEPPVGHLRFKNPIPKVYDVKLWDATYPRSECMQLDSTKASEDCLYLNIYRPMSIKTLPVLVFIHGGLSNFANGSASPEFYGPEYLMDDGRVILVTIQYRLGIFGFLSSGDENCQGNFGLKDQSLALKWIKENIPKFGGDPDSITIAGQRSGASSAHYQIMSPLSNGLFHGAILMSGTALVYWSIETEPIYQFRDMAELANVGNSSTAGTDVIVNHLRTLSSETVLDLTTKKLHLNPLAGIYRPVIEGKWDGAFISEDPGYIWQSGYYEQRPLLVTQVEVEGAFAAVTVFNSSAIDSLMQNAITAFLDAELPFSAAGMLLDFYTHNEPVTEKNARRLVDMDSDRAYLHPIHKTVNDYLQYANVKFNPVNLVKFSFNSSYSLVKLLTGSDIYFGQSHMDDLMYLFKIRQYGIEFTGETAESEMKDKMIDLFVTFSKTGRIPQYDQLEKCTMEKFVTKGFCDYIIFERNTTTTPNSVSIRTSDNLDLEMVRIWDEVDFLSAE